ncbi:MAG: 16S rRNA (cytosine(1402)-N(4))-methyltransferase RsmH [bacterium]
MRDNEYHVGILQSEILECSPKDGILVDVTLGGGSHSELLFEKLENGILISLDRDEDAIKNIVAKFKFNKLDDEIYSLEQENKKWIVVKSEFSDVKKVLKKLEINKVDFLLADVGVSSYQIDEKTRGFSFLEQGPLDMRMDKKQILSAKDLINGLSSKELERIFEKYGEERYSRQIAEAIVKERSRRQLKTTFDIVEIIKKNVGAKYESSKHPARRVFQSLRIAVNNELGELESLCNDIPEVINSGGQVIILTFHSLERNIVEAKFNNYLKIVPGDEELSINSRSKSCTGYIVKVN